MTNCWVFLIVSPYIFSTPQSEHAMEPLIEPRGCTDPHVSSFPLQVILVYSSILQIRRFERGLDLSQLSTAVGSFDLHVNRGSYVGLGCESFSAPLQPSTHKILISSFSPPQRRHTETAHFTAFKHVPNTKKHKRLCTVQLQKLQCVEAVSECDAMSETGLDAALVTPSLRVTAHISWNAEMQSSQSDARRCCGAWSGARSADASTKRGMRNAARAARECETGCQMPLSQTDWAEQKLHRKGMNRAWKAAEVFLPGIVTIMTIMTITLVTCWWHVVKKTHMSRHCAATLRCLQVTRNFFRTSLKHLLCRDFAKIKQSFRKADRQHFWAEHKQESLELIWAWWFS